MSGACQPWPGLRTSEGYGRICRDGVSLLAHRVAYEKAHGPIPAGMVVRHTCDNPGCVNPDHLLIGTHRENAIDKITRGRAKGTRMCEDVATSILADWRRGDLTKGEIAKRHGVSDRSVRKVLRGTTWDWSPACEAARSHITDEATRETILPVMVGTSRYRGVSWDSGRSRWTARIVGPDKRMRRLGRHADEVAAARAYDAAVIGLGLPVWKLNFPHEVAP